MLLLIIIGGLGGSVLLSFASGAGELTESSTFNFCLGHIEAVAIPLILAQSVRNKLLSPQAEQLSI